MCMDLQAALLIAENIEMHCHSLIEVAEKSAPDLLSDATFIAEKFRHTLHLFCA